MVAQIGVELKSPFDQMRGGYNGKRLFYGMLVEFKLAIVTFAIRNGMPWVPGLLFSTNRDQRSKFLSLDSLLSGEHATYDYDSE